MILRKRFFIHQHDAKQCGAACFTMICLLLGENMNLYQAEELIPMGMHGVSLTAISRAGNKIGLESAIYRITLDEICILNKPLILHWNQNHFVVLYKISKNGKYFHIADPAKGCYKITKKELAEHWKSSEKNRVIQGIALYLFPTANFCQGIKEESSELHSVEFIKKYIGKYSGYLYTIIGIMALGFIFQILMPFLTQWIIDLGIKNSDIHFIWLILIGEMMILIGRTTSEFVRQWIFLHISMRINISLLNDFFTKLLKLPMQFFESRQLGDLIQRMADHNRVQDFITSQFLNILFTCLTFLTFGIILFIYNHVIFYIFCFFSAIYSLWIWAFLNKRKRIDYETFDAQSVNQNCVYQFISGMQEIKLQGCGENRRLEWIGAQSKLLLLRLKSLRLDQTRQAGSIFINECKNILITVLAATAVIQGNLTLGGMMALQYIIGQLNSPITQFVDFVNRIQDMNISLERINDIHGRKNENHKERSQVNFENRHHIKLTELSFSYDPNSPEKTLKDISLEIEEGKTTAFVGTSGSGKTTLIKLILGYYPIETGKIEIAGKNLDEYDIDWWRNQCGVVMQEGLIFSESIARNIAAGEKDPDMTRVMEASKIACINSFIESLPLGYYTNIGKNGIGLSIGQKQRILIARAIYKNPAFLFLDEATNSLDATNEKNIVDNLQSFFKHRTVIIVAHRLSTVKNADKIIVLEKGSVVESGNHKELTELKGTYYTLVKDQLELGQ